MYIYRNISWKIIFKFAWKNLLIFLIYGIVIMLAYHELGHIGYDIAIPFSPISTIGIAVAFYLGFKNNQSYDRFWEARKIWGGIINYSRTWGNQVMSYVSTLHTDHEISDKEIVNIKTALIYRHIAWINALRLQLRMPTTFSLSQTKKRTNHFYKGKPGGDDWNKDVAPFLSCRDEISMIEEKVNTATQIIRTQGEHCKELFARGIIEDFRHIDMMHSLEEFYTLQGKCERIKKTPLPRQYSFFSSVFVWIFIILLPLGLVGEFNDMGHNYIWLTIPIYVVIAWVFITMEQVGDSSEDPFENDINDVPMTALCRTIEIDLKDMLGDKNLPEPIKPENGVLM